MVAPSWNADEIGESFCRLTAVPIPPPELGRERLAGATTEFKPGLKTRRDGGWRDWRLLPGCGIDSDELFGEQFLGPR